MTEIERVARALIEAKFGAEGLALFDPIPADFPNRGDAVRRINERLEQARKEARAAIAAMQADRPMAVTPNMADAMLRFLQTPQAKILTNTEGFRQGIEAALAAAPAHPADTYAAGWRDRGEADAKVAAEFAPLDGYTLLGLRKALASTIRALPDQGEAK